MRMDMLQDRFLKAKGRENKHETLIEYCLRNNIQVTRSRPNGYFVRKSKTPTK